MYSVIQYHNGAIKTVLSKYVKKESTYAVFRNYEVKVLCENDNDTLCESFVKNHTSSGDDTASSSQKILKSCSSPNLNIPVLRSLQVNLHRIAENINDQKDSQNITNNDSVVRSVESNIDEFEGNLNNEDFEETDFPVDDQDDEDNDPTYIPDENAMQLSKYLTPDYLIDKTSHISQRDFSIGYPEIENAVGDSYLGSSETSKAYCNDIRYQTITQEITREDFNKLQITAKKNICQDPEAVEFKRNSDINPPHNVCSIEIAKSKHITINRMGYQSSNSLQEVSIPEFSGNLKSRMNVNSSNKENCPPSYCTMEKMSYALTDNPMNQNDIPTRIPASSEPSKKYFCIFCKSLFSKLVLHLENMHKDQPEVVRFSILPKGCEERKKLIGLIRKKGCFEFNTNQNYNNGQLIVSRRPKNATEQTDTYRVCPHCKGYFCRNSIRKHYSKCIPNHNKGDRSISIVGSIIQGQIHCKASHVLRNVFACLRNDDTTRVIRYDALVIIFGNTLCEKYKLQHMHKMIRAKLRLIGRFLLKMKNLDPTIDSYMDVFSTEKFDLALEVINHLGGLDPDRQQYSSPATATEMGTILKKSAKLLITYCIKNKDKSRKQEVEDFFKLLEEDLPIFVNKPVLESQLQQKRRKKYILPTTQEVSKFNNYLEEHRRKYHSLLQNKFTYTVWKELASFCLTSIQVFNRKRAGEVERISVEDFLKYESVDSSYVNDLLQLENITKNYVRFVIRGKLARGVPVLLSIEMVQSLQLILRYRTDAGVPEENPYLFGLPGNSVVFRHLNACELMRRFTKDAEINNPELIRGTTLRKHIATQSALLDINDTEVNDLANFLGHAEKIHREHYRVPVAAREIGRVSELLEIGIGKNSRTKNVTVSLGHQYLENENVENVSGSLENSGPKNVTAPLGSQEDIDNVSGSLENSEKHRDSWNDDIVTEYGRERCVSPLTRKKNVRRSWTTEEVDVAKKLFKKHITMNDVPSILECISAITGNSTLHGRSPVQLKTWVYNQIARKNKNIVKTKTRWTSEEISIMKKEFKRNLDSNLLPGLKVCETVRQKYEALKQRTATSIKAWISNSIRKK